MACKLLHEWPVSCFMSGSIGGFIGCFINGRTIDMTSS